MWWMEAWTTDEIFLFQFFNEKFEQLESINRRNILELSIAAFLLFKSGK